MANVRYAQPKRALDHPHLSHVWQMLGMPNLGARSGTPGRGVILAGDFNSKSPAWGGKVADRRGHACMALLARLGLVPIRVRGRCTFRTGRGSSFIDVLSVDRSLAGLVRKSEVLRHFTASDHLYVRHTLAKPGVARRSPGDGWTPYSMKDVAPESILEGFRVPRNTLPTPPSSLATPVGVSAPPPPPEPSGFTDEVPRAEGLQRLLERVSARVLRKRCLPRGTRKPNRWWNADIAEARSAMHRARRLLQRSRRRLDPSSPRLEQLRRDFSLARRSVQVLIWRSKEKLWRELYGTVDGDPWGKPYRIVMARLGGRKPNTVMTREQVGGVIDTLFATAPLPPLPSPSPAVGPVRTHAPLLSRPLPMRPLSSFWRGIPEVTPEQVDRALSRVKPNKAPGLDRVPSGVVACVARAHKDLIREMMADTLERGGIPAWWKMARVILIPKPGKDPLSPRAYRPISVLPALSKVWEYVMKEILESQLGRDPFHKNQFGFRRGVGTMEAATEVVRFAELSRARNKICLLLSFDVQNAFNTLRWEVVLDELDRRGVDRYVRALLRNYFNIRGITVHSYEGTVVRNIYAGVPQGSVLGPFLWNAVYDGLLTELDMGGAGRAIAYADDLALLFSGRDLPQVRLQMASVLPTIGAWFQKTGLSLAAEKTETILLTGHRVEKTVCLPILNATVTTAARVRYLGVIFDCLRNYRAHLGEVASRADRDSGALSAILPNTRGPSAHARRLYISVWESVILYGSPVWAVALANESARAILRRAQRTALIRCTAAYRTVSFASLCVLVWRMPLYIKAKMGRAIFCAKAQHRENPTLGGDPAILKTRAHLHKAAALTAAMEEWQAEWDRSPPTGWVRRLVPGGRYLCRRLGPLSNVGLLVHAIADGARVFPKILT